jgi:flagellar protein FlbD
VIILTRLGNGLPIAVNPDLIERAEHTPDTVITLIDGHKLVVEEPVGDVVALIRTWRASVAAEGIALARMMTDEVHTSQLPIATEMDDAQMADQAHGTPIGRILRMPTREG